MPRKQCLLNKKWEREIFQLCVNCWTYSIELPFERICEIQKYNLQSAVSSKFPWASSDTATTLQL